MVWGMENHLIGDFKGRWIMNPYQGTHEGCPYVNSYIMVYVISFPNFAFSFANFGGMTALQ